MKPGLLDGLGRPRLGDPKVLLQLVSDSEDVDALAVKLIDLGLSDDAAAREASRAFQKCGERVLEKAAFQLLLSLFVGFSGVSAVVLGLVSVAELGWAPLFPLMILFLGFSNYRQGRVYLGKVFGEAKLEEPNKPGGGSWIWTRFKGHLQENFRARVVGALCVLGTLGVLAWPRVEEALDPNILRGTVRDSSVGDGYIYLYFSKNSPRDAVAVPLSEFRRELLRAGVGNSDAMFANPFLSLGSHYKGERIVARGRAVKQADGSTCVFIGRLMDIRFIE